MPVAAAEGASWEDLVNTPEIQEAARVLREGGWLPFRRRQYTVLVPTAWIVPPLPGFLLPRAGRQTTP